MSAGPDGFVSSVVGGPAAVMAQPRPSDGGYRVLMGFLIACVALLIASFVVTIWPNIHVRTPGMEGFRSKATSFKASSSLSARRFYSILPLRSALAAVENFGASALLAVAFLGDIFFITTGRTALVIIPALVLLYGFRHSGWKGIFGAGVAGLIVAAGLWTTSPYVRERVMGVYSETKLYETKAEVTSAGLRIDFWKQSIRFIENSPLIGHGTRSISDQFQRAATGQKNANDFRSSNPHNQTFAVGIQLGFLGMAVLWAMWITQLLLFRGPGMLAWIGLVIVTSNIVGSLFNSFIFDFTEGWIYVIGVGLVAGMFNKQGEMAESNREMAAMAPVP